MFWIHGGGFASGTGDFNFFDPTPFLVEDVIVVTCNYRLGIFGFLSTEDSVLPGNGGLKDQLLALKWTEDNIAYFGGNPNSITIFGESAGAMSVGDHLVSPKTTGLYTAAILQSGNALTYISSGTPRTNAYALAHSYNSSIISSSDSREVIQVLQGIEADTLRDAALSYSFGPLLEVETNESFITDPRYELLASGAYNQVPIILGHNLEESWTFFPTLALVEQVAASVDSDPSTMLPTMPLKDGVNKTEIGEKIHAAYVGENGSFSDDLAAVLNWKSDTYFVRSCYKDVILQIFPQCICINYLFMALVVKVAVVI
ncbi:carboxylic ester hydrolase-like [Rhynchophorus ferrugineus]|uniref:carboxylic ester hydrolase-like n=1 Tax=Rhynchophorus ferrugineus TaxID=354439 RepID=UPI003FCD0A40